MFWDRDCGLPVVALALSVIAHLSQIESIGMLVIIVELVIVTDDYSDRQWRTDGGAAGRPVTMRAW